MTTIVADARENVMVADSMTTDDTAKWQSQKIERVGDSLFGAAGPCHEAERFMAWLRKGRKTKRPKLTDEFGALELNSEGIFIWDKHCEPFPPGQTFHAMGTGTLAALAAFEMGATASRAVEVACMFDASSSLPLQVFFLSGGK